MAVINPTGTTKKIRSIPRSTDRNVLIPKDCVLRINEKKINNIYFELKNVQLDTATNAVAVLFRVFLETSIDYYASKNGTSFSSNTKLTAKITHVANILEKKKLADTKQLANIRKVSAKGNSILSIQNFNEYVHSFTVQPVPVDLIYKWDNLQEFFEILFRDLISKNRSRKKTT